MGQSVAYQKEFHMRVCEICMTFPGTLLRVTYSSALNKTPDYDKKDKQYLFKNVKPIIN